jgi:hypothetical protein
MTPTGGEGESEREGGREKEGEGGALEMASSDFRSIIVTDGSLISDTPSLHFI